MRADSLVDGVGDVVGQIHETASRVQQGADLDVVDDGSRFAALPHGSQSDEELCVFPALRDDWKRLELAMVLSRVDTSEQDLSCR